MPIDIRRVFSDVQTDIGDLSGERVQPAMWSDLVNRVASDIAREVRMWMGRMTVVPNPSWQQWSAGTIYTQGMIVSDAGNYYLCLLSHTSAAATQPSTLAAPNATWQLIPAWSSGTAYAIGAIVYTAGPTFFRAIQAHTASLPNIPPDTGFWSAMAGWTNSVYSVKLPFALNGTTVAPWRIVRIVRQDTATGQWRETHEYSQQSIAATISENDSFWINQTRLDGSSYAVQFTDPLGAVDGSLTLVFGEAFSPDEVLVIDYITNVPFTSLLWTDAVPIAIPEELYDSFKWGLLTRLCQKLYFAGDESMMPRMQVAERNFRTALNEAAAYARMLNNTRNGLQIQPMNYLPED